MIDDRDRELISAAIDGDLDPADQARVEQLLSSSADAQAFKAELEQLDRLLEGVPELDPPASLHAKILSQASLVKGRRESTSLEWLRSLMPGAGLRYAIAAATGALVAAVFVGSPTMMSNQTDITSLVGTMAPGNGASDPRVVNTVAVVGDGFESLARLAVRDGYLLLTVLVDTTVPLDVSVDLAKAGYQTDAIAQLNSQFESIAIAGQALQLRAVGKQEITVLLRRVEDAAGTEEASISLEFSSDGKLLQRGTLAANLEGVRQ